jgi:divalent metal cation (Fe/Co/Zn/Cd) transporter
MGLAIVLISSLLSLINPIFDVIGTFMVGSLLITMSYFLSNELRNLMIGESIPRSTKNTVRSIVLKHRAVRHINNIRSMYIGRNDFILLISVDIRDTERGSEIESMTEQIRYEILHLYPHAKYIYIDISEE